MHPVQILQANISKLSANDRLTGYCCFCAKKLDDPRSTAVGYGSTCSRNWGLPWGAKAAKAVLSCEGEAA